MKITLGRFFATAGVILGAILFGGLVALPTPSVKNVSTPVESLQITALVALWVVALVIFLSRHDRAMEVIVALAGLVAVWLWGPKLLKSFSDVVAWMAKLDIANIFSPELALVAFIAIGATLIVMIIFDGTFRRS